VNPKAIVRLRRIIKKSLAFMAPKISSELSPMSVIKVVVHSSNNISSLVVVIVVVVVVLVMLVVLEVVIL
jgi:hypothetical protein